MKKGKFVAVNKVTGKQYSVTVKDSEWEKRFTNLLKKAVFPKSKRLEN